MWGNGQSVKSRNLTFWAIFPSDSSRNQNAPSTSSFFASYTRPAQAWIYGGGNVLVGIRLPASYTTFVWLNESVIRAQRAVLSCMSQHAGGTSAHVIMNNNNRKLQHLWNSSAASPELDDRRYWCCCCLLLLLFHVRKISYEDRLSIEAAAAAAGMEYYSIWKYDV